MSLRPECLFEPGTWVLVQGPRLCYVEHIVVFNAKVHERATITQQRSEMTNRRNGSYLKGM
jgi:hypothetical protein